MLFLFWMHFLSVSIIFTSPSLRLPPPPFSCLRFLNNFPLPSSLSNLNLIIIIRLQVPRLALRHRLSTLTGGVCRPTPWRRRPIAFLCFILSVSALQPLAKRVRAAADWLLVKRITTGFIQMETVTGETAWSVWIRPPRASSPASGLQVFNSNSDERTLIVNGTWYLHTVSVLPAVDSSLDQERVVLAWKLKQRTAVDSSKLGVISSALYLRLSAACGRDREWKNI